MCVAHWVSPSHGYGYRCLVIEISGTYLVTFFCSRTTHTRQAASVTATPRRPTTSAKMQQFRKLQLHLCLWSIILLYSMWFYLPCKAVSLGLNLKCFVFLPLSACAIFWCNNIFSKLIIHSVLFKFRLGFLTWVSFLTSCHLQSSELRLVQLFLWGNEWRGNLLLI